MRAVSIGEYDSSMTDPKLLDDSLLEGQHAVIRQIGPEPIAILVDANDLSDFVGLLCQRTSGLWRSVAIASRPTKSAESPINKGNPGKQRDAGGGTRTPDTRIMIPRVQRPNLL